MFDLFKIVVSSFIAIAVKSAVLLSTFWIGFTQMNTIKFFIHVTEISRFHMWTLHFVTGIIITFMYAKFFNKMLIGIRNNFLRAMTYGFIIAVFAQLFLLVLINTIPYSSDVLLKNEDIFIMFLELTFGYIIFGGTLGLFYGRDRKQKVI